MAVGFFGKILHGGSKANKSGKAINTVKIAEGSLKDRRKDFEDLGKRVSQYTQDPNISEAGKIKLRETIQPVAKKISKLHDEKDKITKRNKSSKAMIEASKGRKQLKFGGSSTRKSNVQKIKETFGPKKQLSAKQMKIAKLAGNPKKIDAQDLAKLRGRG